MSRIATITPPPAEIESVLSGMLDGTNPYIQWLKQGAIPNKEFHRAHYRVTPVEDGVEHEVCACGHTLGEATAAAWIGAFFDDGVQGTPPSAIVYAVPEFIWGMSANRREKKISAEHFVGRDCSYPRPRPNKNRTKATIRTTPSMPITPPVPLWENA